MGLIDKRWDVLIRLINTYKFKTFVEVGSLYGDTSYKVLRACPSLAKAYLVDPLKAEFNTIPEHSYVCGEEDWHMHSQPGLDSVYEHVRERFKRIPRAAVIRKTSEAASKGFKPESLDLVFIDAIHLYDYAKQDIQSWLPKLKPGGILAGHDYQKAFPGVIKAVDEFCPEGKLHVEGDHVWWFFKEAKDDNMVCLGVQ